MPTIAELLDRADMPVIPDLTVPIQPIGPASAPGAQQALARMDEEDRNLLDFVRTQQAQFLVSANQRVESPQDLLQEVVCVARMAVARGEPVDKVAKIYKVAADLLAGGPAGGQHLHLHGAAATGRLEAMTDAALYERIRQLEQDVLVPGAAPAGGAAPTRPAG